MSKAVQYIVAAVALFGATQSAVALNFTPPRGCTISLTVQMHQCQVANIYTCTGDAPGDQWISYADDIGVYYSSRIDYETRWMESIDHDSGEVTRLLPKASDHASFTTLLATGRDDYDFMTESSEGYVERFIGTDLLTGVTVLIDGIALERATFDLSSFDSEGNLLNRRTGNQFISRDLRMFFGDTELFENAAGERIESLQAPILFALPGEEGFGSATPLFDCNSVLTGSFPPGGA